MGTFTKPAREFESIPVVIEHIALASKMVGAYTADMFVDEVESRIRCDMGENVSPDHVNDRLEFDSPLETLFWVWWMEARRVDRFCDHNIVMLRHVDAQASGSNYVVDFVVAPAPKANASYVDANWPLIGIELDGHAFHEKTLDQVTYRNQRDRALQKAGWHLFHFSFSEFVKNPSDSIWEVIEFARSAYWQTIKKHSSTTRKD